METKTQADAPAPCGGRHAVHFYTPGPRVLEAPGLTRREDHISDYYVGTKEALVAAGLLPGHMFPGEPGMPRKSVSLRPQGCGPGPGRPSIFSTPGYVMVRSLSAGRFELRLCIPLDERAKRREQQAADQARDRSREPGLITDSETDPETAGRYLLGLIWKRLGPAWLSSEVDRMCKTHGAPRRPRPDHLRVVWSA